MLAITTKVKNLTWFYRDGKRWTLDEGLAIKVHSQRMASEYLREAKHTAAQEFPKCEVIITQVSDEVKERQGTFLTEIVD